MKGLSTMENDSFFGPVTQEQAGFNTIDMTTLAVLLFFFT